MTAATAHIHITGHPGLATRDELWELYERLFADLAEQAAFRHVMRWEDFANWARDPRWTKYLAYDADGTLVGAGTQTNVLEADALISPPYFRRRWPGLYLAGNIWHVGFICVQDGNPGLFRQLLDVMSRPARDARGITILDFAAYNVDVRHLPQVSDTILKDLHPGARVARYDRQDIWVAHFDEPESSP